MRYLDYATYWSIRWKAAELPQIEYWQHSAATNQTNKTNRTNKTN